MNGESTPETGSSAGTPWWRRRWFRVFASLALLCCVALLAGAEYVLHHAEPILRKRIVETLSDRFDAPVELQRVEISLFHGIEVDGTGLRIPFGSGTPASPTAPLISVQHFAFRTSLDGLLHQPTRVSTVTVEGMEINLPPPGQRAHMLGTREGREPADPQNPHLRPRIAMVVSTLQCHNVKLLLDSSDPHKDPLEFDIARLTLRDVGRDQPMLYDAQLTNPKPTGEIHAVGHFGPWGGSAHLPGEVADPGQTPLDGDYTFDRADLNSIHGIGGMLSSTGHFAGVLDRLLVDGHTSTPDFSLDRSDRPMPLETDFHAVVDGTSGDTFLEPVHARLGSSAFTAVGRIVRIKGQGHDIDLQVTIPHGHMQDFLRLAVKTEPPLMNGVLTMEAKLHIPPGKQRVAQKMSMAGSFRMGEVAFNNPRLQDRLDGLSARAVGDPEKAKQVSEDRRVEARSRLAADFTLDHGVIAVSDVRYALPGALVLMNGVYSMDGNLFEFKGHVRTKATASQMVGGWKGWLLKPADLFLRKNGAGLELPVEISGTSGDLHLGLAFHGTDDTPRQMLTDVRARQHQKQEFAQARREADEADREDLRAAQAPTLQAAEQAHRAAVRRREEAQRRAAEALQGAPQR